MNTEWCKKHCQYVMNCGHIGICEQVMYFVRNQTPVPPNIIENSYGKKSYYCPACEMEFFTYDNFCCDCGQAINWNGIRIQTSDIVKKKKK